LRRFEKPLAADNVVIFFVVSRRQNYPCGIISASDIARASCASLHGEFATIVSTAELVVSLQS
jgi:hypothetical protein